LLVKTVPVNQPWWVFLWLLSGRLWAN